MRGGKIDTSFFWLKRIHSFIVFIPLTAALILYLAGYSMAFRGPQAFDRMVSLVHSFPLTAPLEILFIAIPIVFYVLMGLVLIYRSSANVVAYGYYRNWIYILDRLFGLIASVFVVYHFWSTRIVPAALGKFATFEYIHSRLAHPWIQALYVAGIIALVYHCMSRSAALFTTLGIVQGRKARWALSIASWSLMVVIGLWGIGIVFAFS